MGLSILVAGGTGLVGRALLRRLVAADDVDRVVGLSRRPGGATSLKVSEVLADFANPALPPGFVPDAALCALGTTIRTAGSQEAFRAVDHGAVLAFARAAQAAGARTFALVSSVDANPGARNFYLRTKGEVERDLAALGFPALHILRPSLLLGARQESRPAERLAMLVTPALSPLMLGTLSRYRPIPADTVAAALLGAARQGPPGGVHHFEGIRALAGVG